MSTYANLVAEMARRRLLRKDIATVLGVSLQTVGLKLKGRFSFSLDEAKTIHNELFSDCDFVYLFKREDKSDTPQAS